MVETTGGAEPRITRIEFEPPVRLLSIPEQAQAVDQVMAAIEALPDGELTQSSPYLEVKVLLTGPEPSLRHRIQTALEGKSVRLARLTASIPTGTANSRGPLTYEEIRTIQPMEMACDIYAKRYGGEPMPERMKNMMQQVIEEVQE